MSQKNQENNPSTSSGQDLKISVVIPAYNEEKRISRCLSALEEQDFPREEYEIIVVDNNSTDNSYKIAQAFEGVKVIQELERQGVGAAREAGWKIAQGEIIMSTDADCEPPKNWMKKVYKAFEKDQELVGMSAGYTFYDRSYLFNILVVVMEIILVTTTWLLSRGVFGFTGNNMAARRSTYLKTPGFDTTRKFGEDMDIASKLQKHGKIHWFFAPGYRIKTSSRRYRLGPDTLHLVPYFLNFLSSSAKNSTWRNEMKDVR